MHDARHKKDFSPSIAMRAWMELHSHFTKYEVRTMVHEAPSEMDLITMEGLGLLLSRNPPTTSGNPYVAYLRGWES